MREKAMAELMTRRWKKYRLLLTTLLSVVSLGAIYAGYSARISAVISSRLPSLGSKSRSSTSQIHGVSLQDVQAGDTTVKISSSAVMSQKEQIIKEKSVTPITTPHGIDNSVEGQSFEISASIKQGCKSDHIECPLVMASVGKMVKEPRDMDWAAKMEATIQSAFDSQGSDKYVIRNVECRTSICILEVEGHVPEATNRYEGAIVFSLRPHALTSVREHDSSGASYRVELMDFERR
jgi:hypothetical protein